MPGDLSLCYTCGQEEPTHHRRCPDHEVNARDMYKLTNYEFDSLIPIGTYYYDFIDGGRLRQDIEARQ